MAERTEILPTDPRGDLLQFQSGADGYRLPAVMSLGNGPLTPEQQGALEDAKQILNHNSRWQELFAEIIPTYIEGLREEEKENSDGNTERDTIRRNMLAEESPGSFEMDYLIKNSHILPPPDALTFLPVVLTSTVIGIALSPNVEAQNFVFRSVMAHFDVERFMADTLSVGDKVGERNWVLTRLDIAEGIISEWYPQLADTYRQEEQLRNADLAPLRAQSVIEGE